jgi:hypothetical protein
MAIFFVSQQLSNNWCTRCSIIRMFQSAFFVWNFPVQQKSDEQYLYHNYCHLVTDILTQCTSIIQPAYKCRTFVESCKI